MFLNDHISINQTFILSYEYIELYIIEVINHTKSIPFYSYIP